MDYTQRLSTFISWPLQMKPSAAELAAANFIYTGMSDIVKCITCGLKLKHWERTDVAMTEHQKHSKDCNFLKEFSNLHLNKDQFKWQWVGHPPPYAREDYGFEVVYSESEGWLADFQECLSQAKIAGKSISFPDCFGCQLLIKVRSV